MAKEILKNILYVQNSVRLYHWSTKSYARHVSSGDLYSNLDKLFDRFIETYQGWKGMWIMSAASPTPSINLSFGPISDQKIIEIVEDFREFLAILNDLPMDLENIRDEILGELNRVLFLFTLN